MKILSLFAFVIITSSCSSQKIDNTIGPFTGNYQPYAQSWTGGIPGSGSGVNLFLTLFDMDPASVQEVYYNGMVTTQIEQVEKPAKYIVARFKTNFNNKPDIDMNVDPKKEYGNKPPKKEDFPFDLEKDEAVVKIASNGKYIYTKIKGIQMRSPQDLPSRPQ
jgi:hypothetical protein